MNGPLLRRLASGLVLSVFFLPAALVIGERLGGAGDEGQGRKDTLLPSMTGTPFVQDLRAEDTTDDSVTLVADLALPAGETRQVTFYLGHDNGGARTDAWQFSLALGAHSAGRVSIPVEGLEPGLAYFFAVRLEDANRRLATWSSSLRFATRLGARLVTDPHWIKTLDPRDMPARGFISVRPAARWEEGLLSGNGTLGAVVMSRPLEERILVSHERLFLPWHAALPPPETAKDLPAIRLLIARGRYQEAADLVAQRSLEAGYSVKRWTDAFIPAFDLLVHTPEGGNMRYYLRSLDYSTGATSVRWEDARGAFRRRLFVSRADNVIVMSYAGPGPGRLDCSLELAQRPLDKVNTYWGPHEKFVEGIRSIEVVARPGWLTYRSAFAKSAGGYQGVARVTTRGGTVRVDGRKLVVSAADEVLVLVRAEVLGQFDPAALGPLQAALGSLPDDFGGLLARHARVHGPLYDRVSLDLGGGTDRALPSDDLLARARRGDVSPALLERMFDAGRYEILSSSGRWPPNLQGVWTGTWGSPRSGDYTLDGNLETAVANLLDGRLPECMLPLFDYVESLVPAFRENARRLYGARGILLGPRASTHGYDNHFDGTWPMTFWTAGAGWLSHFYYDYYLHTGDRAFLRDRAVPFMKEAAAFYEDFLVEDARHHYLFSPSYSPENNPLNSPSQAAVNATMDIAVAKELLANLVEACRTLGIERGGIARWTRMLDRMPDYQVNADGALKEWAWPALADNYAHGHASHLYPLFYGLAPDVAASPALLAAAHRAIQFRLAERAKHEGGEMGFGAVQLGQAAASLGDGDTVMTILGWLATHYYYASFASSHDPGPETFNADISGGVPDLITRMLVQSRPGRLDLLPARSRDLPDGSLSGVLARGQVLVKSLSWQGPTIRATLVSPRAQAVEVSAPRPIVTVAADVPQTIAAKPAGARLRVVNLPAGQDVTLTFVLGR